MYEVSLSSWNYGSFSFSKTNPYFCNEKNNLRRNNSVKENINNIKIVKQEYFENIPFEKYINRESYLKNEFIVKLKQKRIEDLILIKKFGKTFDAWKRKKNKKIRIEKILKKKQEKLREEDQLIKNEIQNNNRITFKQWKKGKIELEKKKEEKRIENENKMKLTLDIINKERKKRMKTWKKQKSELIKKRKELEIKNEEEIIIEKEKINEEKKEKNKIAFINWLNKKNLQNKINETNKENNNKNNEPKKVKTKEIIGPFFFAKQMRQAQKNYYNNINKNA